MIKNASFAVFAGLGLVLFACAGAEETDQSTDDVTAQKDVAGFDFKGFQVGKAPATAEICAAVLNPVDEACIAAGGERSRAKGCAVLCSVPVAEQNKVAGFDFDGFKVGDIAEAEICPEIVDAVAERCHDAGGKSTAIKGCASVCSVPIAERGKVAGYDFKGPKTLEAPKPNVFCPEVVRPEQEACIRAEGKHIEAANCQSLCSKPIVKR